MHSNVFCSCAVWIERLHKRTKKASRCTYECVVLDCWIMVSRCALAPLPCGDVVQMGMLNTVCIYICGIRQCTYGKEAWSKCTNCGCCAKDDAMVLYLASWSSSPIGVHVQYNVPIWIVFARYWSSKHSLQCHFDHVLYINLELNVNSTLLIQIDVILKCYMFLCRGKFVHVSACAWVQSQLLLFCVRDEIWFARTCIKANFCSCNSYTVLHVDNYYY